MADAVTDPLFVEDAYARSCAAKVVGVSDTGAIQLDRTVFYAAGGGQPGDIGELRWDGGACRIGATVKGEAPGAILHIPAEGETPPPEGVDVEATLTWEMRFKHMRMHTALHLLSVVLPLPVTGGQIGAEKGRLDFDMPEAPEDKAALEARLNALIAEDHPVSFEWITDAEMEANPGLVKTMAVKPPMGQGRVRLVRIGAGETPVDLQPCGGTHVSSTAEIGSVAIGKVEKKGKQNRRVNLLFA
ncbi:MAG: alanyl-tRNA editing protein [Rhodobacteraceae bacterium]|nr:alanyl-tRNA editing protein [Paracoccaceae bacterium]